MKSRQIQKRDCKIACIGDRVEFIHEMNHPKFGIVKQGTQFVVDKKIYNPEIALYTKSHDYHLISSSQLFEGNLYVNTEWYKIVEKKT